MPKIKVVVGPPGGKPVLVIDEETGRLLLYTVTYNKRIAPGEYTDPEDIVNIFVNLATRGHETKNAVVNPDIIYQFIVALLLSDAPPKEKVEQVKRYVRAAIKV